MIRSGCNKRPNNSNKRIVQTSRTSRYALALDNIKRLIAMNQYDAMLEDLVDEYRTARAEELGQICYESPEWCNLCGTSLLDQRFLIDGEVKDTLQTPIPGHRSVGQWSFMCGACYAKRGCGVGWGTGQLFRRNSEGIWIMAAGFPPDESDDA